VGCRIIAAPNRDLGALAEEGGFRNDLYYRLNVLRIELPPLRERPGDVDRLAEHFVTGISQEHGLGRKELTEEARQVLRTHAWLGNVRELKNVLESALVMSDGVEVRPEHIRLRKRATVAVPGDVILAHGSVGHAPSGNGRSVEDTTGGDVRSGPARNGQRHTAADSEARLTGDWRAVVPSVDAMNSGVPHAAHGNVADDERALIRVPFGGVTLDEMERALFRETSRLADGNRSLMARMLGISRATVIRKLDRYGLD
jgi:DNA-binding NtrC family response regulator